MSNDRYAYAVGRVRAMETQLLEKNKVDRMVDALDINEALKVLGETVYAEHFAGLKTLHDYDFVLDQELYRVYRELHQFSPQAELIGIFACRFDYHNLKVLFKAHTMDEKRGELLVEEIGRISPAVLARAINEDDYINLPPQMRQAAAQLSEILRIEPNPQIVDLLLDRAMFAEIFDMLAELDSPFLTEYFTCLVDLTNIKTYLRVKRAGYPREFLEQALLPFGELNISRMVQLADPPEVLIDRLMFSRYASFMEEAILA
ncbi:V-type ATPase subunit, partial [candidate division NPL-UPA2 bacterium]|nr:V-type ATPase subunit [candidate division NPL-UPA2 bacterium]